MLCSSLCSCPARPFVLYVCSSFVRSFVLDLCMYVVLYLISVGRSCVLSLLRSLCHYFVGDLGYVISSFVRHFFISFVLYVNR